MKDLKIELNIKSIVLFEQLTNKSFYEMGQEDLVVLLYAILVVNNPQYKMTYDEFEKVLACKKLAAGMLKQLDEEIKYTYSLSANKATSSIDGGEDKPEKMAKITDIVCQLITTYHIDINYVMEKMKLWELVPVSKSVEKTVQQEMEDKRFWTYLNIMPHVDAKKIGGPQKFLPFEWEKDVDKEKNKKFLEKNYDKIKELLYKNNNSDAERDENKPGRGRPDDSEGETEPAGESGTVQGSK